MPERFSVGKYEFHTPVEEDRITDKRLISQTVKIMFIQAMRNARSHSPVRRRLILRLHLNG
jgi:hypothetical protein